jgi:tetratricopeptide (TPR) repeat protein
MASTDVPAPAAVPPAPRRARPRWFWLLLAGAVLVPGGLLAREGWGYWQERAARRELADEHFDEAQRHIDLALRVRDGWTSTHLLAARIARHQGAYSRAEQHLSRCGQRDRLSEAVQLEWLLLRCQRGDVDELAPALLASVDRGHPESAVILEALAAVFMRQTRYHEALRCLDRWVELDPDCVHALDWRGWVSNQLDQRAQAITDYERALELQPGRSAVRLRLAEIFVASSRHAEAVPHLEQLRQEQPDNPDVAADLASCLIVQSRTDEARALLDPVLAAHPDHLDALVQRGKVEMEDGNFAEAERWLRQALRRSPRDADARYALYLALQAQGGREGEARDELERWKQDRKARDRLIRLLRMELERKPNDPDLAAEAGELFLGQGEDQKGLFWLHRALAFDPRHAASHRALAAYYERTGHPDRAAEHRRQLDAPGPGNGPQ